MLFFLSSLKVNIAMNVRLSMGIHAYQWNSENITPVGTKLLKVRLEIGQFSDSETSWTFFAQDG